MSSRPGATDAAFWGDADDDVALQRYRTLLSTIDDGIYQLDADGRFVAVNDVIVETTGYSRGDLLGEHVSMLLSDGDADRLTRAIANQLDSDGDDVGTFELAVRTADGESVPCEIRIRLLVEDGEFQGSIGVARDITRARERVETLESARASYDSIQNVLEEANVGVIVLDDALEVAYVNAPIETYFGLDRADLVGRDKRQVVTDRMTERVDDGDGFADRLLATYADDSYVEQFECEITAGDDREARWIEHYSKPIESGQYAGGRIEFYNDITDRKRSEDALRETEERFQSLVDAVEEYAIFRLDADGHVISWNEGARTIKGYDSGEILGEHFSTFYTAADRDTGVPERNLRRATETGSFEDEGWRVRKDGTRFWANVTITPVRDEDGTHRGYLKVTRDMTDRRERERELQSELQQMLGRISDAFYAVDEDLRFTHFNERAEELLRRSEEELLGERLWDVFPSAAEIDEVEDAFRTAIESQEATSYELYYDTLDLWVEANLYPSETGISVYFRDVTERKERERELARFKRAVEASGHAIYMTDVDGEITYVNPAFESTTGYTAEEAVGETPTILQSGAHDDAYYRDLWETVRTGDVWEEEITDRRKDGELYYAQQTIAPVTDESGEIDRFVAVQNDVTERKERERQLRKRERNLEQYKEYIDDVIDAIDDVFYILDADGELVRWNESLGSVTGYAEREILEMNATKFFDEAGGERIASAIAEGFETENVQVQEAIRTSDGEHVPYEFVASTLEDPDGNPVLVGIGRDVTERKERERELERRARQQQVVADLGQFALESDDLDGLMFEAASQVAAVLDNDYCEVLDLDADDRELLLRQGVGWHEGIVGEATVGADEDDSQAGYTLQSDEPVVVDDLGAETRFSGPELLTDHDVRSGISTVIGSVDDPWGILGTHDTSRQEFTVEDVNFVQSVANVLAEAIERERYQAELEGLVADLEESNERLEQFAYAASHDLQEPLRMVSSYLRLIEDRYSDVLDEDGEEFVEFAVDGADRMRDMIDGLLQYSRVETQGDPFEPVDLGEVFDVVLDDLQVRIDETEAEIDDGDLPRVEGDPSQLRQVFQNLLSNAIEYSGDEPPRIGVSAERIGGEWIVSVRDQGIGIDPGDTDRIFQVFQRLHTHDEHPGTGIGLALCRRIVERHGVRPNSTRPGSTDERSESVGGEIWVDTEPGEGSTFSFTLPVARE